MLLRFCCTAVTTELKEGVTHVELATETGKKSDDENNNDEGTNGYDKSSLYVDVKQRGAIVNILSDQFLGLWGFCL